MKRGGVRILGGRLQGRRLDVPGSARPTTSKVREALFSIWGGDVAGRRFLDLFAGSGVVGLEALSRGAVQSTFVESSKNALMTLRRNCQLAERGSYRLVALQLPKVGTKLAKEGFAFVFADPPYDFDQYAPLLAAVRPLVTEDGELVIEHSSRATLPAVSGWQEGQTRRYGESCLSFLRPVSPTPPQPTPPLPTAEVP